MENQYKIAVVGVESSVIVYKALGMDIFGVTNGQEAAEKVETLFFSEQEGVEGMAKYAIIFVEENFYAEIPVEILKRFGKRALPAVTPIPSPATISDGKSLGETRIKMIVEKAVGSDIL